MYRFVVGDIHGAYRSLMQVLDRAEFNPKRDSLIALGDYVDGWTETYDVIEYLRELPHFVGILGNHDKWALDWMDNPDKPLEDIWVYQGGANTLRSYQYTINRQHREFLHNCLPYYIVDTMLFVHGGYDPEKDITMQNIDYLLWDRDLFRYAFMYQQNKHIQNILGNISYDKVFIGHTPTEIVHTTKPLIQHKVYGLDTGAGWSGVLTLMNIDTDEYWQSDTVSLLYPEEKGRM